MKITHVKKSKLRNYTLRFNEKAELVVTTNKSVPTSYISKIIDNHRDWIETNFKKVFAQFKESEKYKVKFIQGNQIRILEEDYVIKYTNTKLNPERSNLRSVNPYAYLDMNMLVIDFAKKELNEKEINKIIKKLLVKIARTEIESKTVYYTQKYQTTFNKVSIKDLKSKWGSCSTLRNLNFNWRLIFADQKILDYVVIHEVCHLLQMNHSSKFWDEVKKEYPEYKKARNYLKENRILLQNLV